MDGEKCRGCGKCMAAAACPIKISAVTDGKLAIDGEKCNGCGRCLKACPFGAISESVRGYRMYVGGRWGKQTARDREIDHVFTSDEEVMDAMERAMDFFKAEGVNGERFADTIARVGFEKAILGE